MEDLIGRKMIGFRFEDDEHRFFCADTMEKYVGSLGEILHFGMNGTVCVKFPNGDGFYYPIELVEEYLIPEEIKVHDMEETYVSECDSQGVKNNSEKLPMSKLKVQFPNALQAVVLCSSMGHEKYKDADEDWLNFTRVPGGSETYRDACERHSLYKVGDVDEESGLPHLFHELWNKMAEVEIWISENNKEINI